MILNNIQSLKNKMELQISRLETRIENMQEMFNMELEEIKKSQPIKNTAITEINSTLEGTKNRVTEAEDRISEVEDRMLEINESERDKEKELKEMKTTSETSKTMSNAPTFESQESKNKKTERKAMRKYLRR